MATLTVTSNKSNETIFSASRYNSSTFYKLETSVYASNPLVEAMVKIWEVDNLDFETIGDCFLELFDVSYEISE